MPQKETAMHFDGQELAQATRGSCIQPGPAGEICTDTRTLKRGDWFLAIVGARFDGHTFAQKAREIGVAGIIGQHVPQGWDRGFIQVSNSITALQNIARFIRKQYTGLVIGITGSAGKTTTRALISSVLSQKGTVLATRGNFNNHIGLPLTLLRSNLNERFWVLEMGMNHFGEIQLLQEIAQPHIRLITNVGAAHLEGVGSIEGVAKAKGELFDGANAGDLCVRNADDHRIMIHPLRSDVRTVEFGSASSAHVCIVDASIDNHSLNTNISLNTDRGPLNVSLASPGIHLASNVASAVAVGLDQHCDLEMIKNGIEGYQPVGARLRIEKGKRGIRWINDAYNANPLSMRASLTTLSQLQGHPTHALMGDMLELGEKALDEHKELLAYALSLKIETIGVCGELFVEAAQSMMDANAESSKLIVAHNSNELGKKMQHMLKEGDIVLLKGSRGIKMERVIGLLEQE